MGPNQKRLSEMADKALGEMGAEGRAEYASKMRELGDHLHAAGDAVECGDDKRATDEIMAAAPHMAGILTAIAAAATQLELAKEDDSGWH